MLPSIVFCCKDCLIFSEWGIINDYFEALTHLQYRWLLFWMMLFSEWCVMVFSQWAVRRFRWLESVACAVVCWVVVVHSGHPERALVSRDPLFTQYQQTSSDLFLSNSNLAQTSFHLLTFTKGFTMGIYCVAAWTNESFVFSMVVVCLLVEYFFHHLFNNVLLKNFLLKKKRKRKKQRKSVFWSCTTQVNWQGKMLTVFQNAAKDLFFFFFLKMFKKTNPVLFLQVIRVQMSPNVKLFQLHHAK